MQFDGTYTWFRETAEEEILDRKMSAWEATVNYPLKFTEQQLALKIMSQVKCN